MNIMISRHPLLSCLMLKFSKSIQIVLEKKYLMCYVSNYKNGHLSALNDRLHFKVRHKLSIHIPINPHFLLKPPSIIAAFY